MTTPAGVLVAVIITATTPHGSPALAPVAQGVVEEVLPSGGSLQAALEPDREPPAGSGVEFTRYVSPPQLHNGFLAGGLVAWTSVLFGGLLLLDKRRVAAAAIAGGGLVIGVALMFTGVL